MKARLLLLPLVAGPADVVVTAGRAGPGRPAPRPSSLPAGTLVVPVPLAPRGVAPSTELRASAVVAAAYGATHLLVDPSDVPDAGSPVAGTPRTARCTAGLPIPVISAGDWAYDPAVGGVAAAGADRAGRRTGRADRRRAARLLDRGDAARPGTRPEAVARELRRARPPRDERGLVDLLHRAVRLGQVHHRPRTCATR